MVHSPSGMEIQLEIIREELNTLEFATEILPSPFLPSGLLVTCFIVLFSSPVVISPLCSDHILMCLLLLLDGDEVLCAVGALYSA